MAIRREETELLVMDRVLRGSLPGGERHKVSGSRGAGCACACCERPIAHGQIQVSVALNDWKDDCALSMHLDCYNAWSVISMTLPQTHLVQGDLIETSSTSGIGIRTFLIAYSNELLITCSTILSAKGYSITSAVGNKAAKTALETGGKPYDLFVIGSAAPDRIRQEMLNWLRLRYSQATIFMLSAALNQKFRDPNTSNTDHWFSGATGPTLQLS